jgi:hypothetical protein
VLTLPGIDELERFFDAEGKVGTPESPWQESSLTIETTITGDRLWFELIPRIAHAQLRWVGQPFRVFDLHLDGISSIAIVGGDKTDHMLIRFDSNQVLDFKLFLRPNCLVFWGNGDPNEYDA